MAGTTESRRWTAAGGGEPFDITVYVPQRLEARDLGAAESDAIATAERALREFADDRNSLRDAGLVLLRSEGIASSRIEGLFLGTRRLFEARHAPDAVDDRTAEQILANMAIMEDVIEGAGAPLTEELIRNWHAQIMGRDAREILEPGRLRTRQNWVGGNALSPRGADFVPPPPDLVPGLVSDLVGWSNRVDVGGLVQAAVAHAQFETIHPFIDGNGRVGRALIYRIFAFRGLIGSVAPPLSPILAQRRRDYVAGLDAWRAGADDLWLTFFAEVVVESVQYARRLADRLSSLRSEWEERLADVRRDAVAHRIVVDLASTPVLDRSFVSRTFGVSGEAAANALRQLAERGIVEGRPLRRARRGRPARVYEATQVFDVLDTPPSLLG